LLGEELEDPTTGQYYPTLSDGNELVATNMYFSDLKPISVIATGTIEGLTEPADVWV